MKIYALVLSTLFMFGCSTLPSEPYTPEQKLMLAYSVNTGLRVAAVEALKENALSLVKASNILSVTNTTRAILDESQQGKTNSVDYSSQRWVNILNVDNEARQSLRTEILNRNSLTNQ